ncbi:colanic acid biosynthesis glycosyltransferase WcaL [Aequorivita sp. H23M31]|uniref:Colanic acid biosynthesis glycosyltransferase WcaL n=1 Tax=Aequorivita ciconiae TaxID=2494375 RepID=A0A410G290_9FLAO|nr:glycosyltransferase family 4 protein [Aequorivita sp. H23M31]QAA81363.1 colanic acid biosynthesis glycosyltransferase WcaL [Aequorivita sp. H23M31]
MKIGLVLSTTPGYSETFFHSKIKGLQNNGIEVHLFCSNKKKDFTLCPVVESAKVSKNPVLMSWYLAKEYIYLLPYVSTVAHYVNLERKEGMGWVTIFKRIYLNAHLLRAKVDWLHFGFATLALGKETVAKAIGAKMAISFRGFDIGVYPVKFPNCYKLLWKYVDKVHANSNDILVLAKKYGLPENVPVQRITPAIDVERFSAALQNFSKKSITIFMTTGRLHWKKGLVQTVEALAILKNQGFDFIYKIVGEGEEYERIAFAAYQLGLKENVQFLGKLNHSEVKWELEKTDIYLQYSIQEGFCNAVLEAQAMGKLCIVSDAEGLPENVLHEHSGWVVPKHSPELLAQQIMKVISMEKQAKIKISQNAVKRVKENFNIEKQQREFLEFYG